MFINQNTHGLITTFKAHPELKKLKAVEISLDMHRYVNFPDPYEFILVTNNINHMKTL